ncbi:MAG TPA: aspartate/glutamate racemase family protein [Crenalkalicoccus sp.]|jgi:Asp/Glu/hydantoin racemase|nr:aspartate/glutamate racemase family protein [Crenalkalicoccus sp.]
MRIWHQSMAPIAHLTGYTDALARHAALACSPGVEVYFNGAAEEPYRGTTPADLLRYPYAKHVLGEEAIGHALRAEREGFDALILGSFSEPFLPEIRSLLDIPVVSMPEASMLLACSLAESFALVTLGPSNIIRVRKTVARHGMQARVSGVHAFARQWDEAQLNAAFADPAALIESFSEVARRALADGADLVIPAEGVLNEVLFQHGLREIDGAAVMDCVGAALLHAEMQVNARQKLGLAAGRRWARRPTPEVLERLRAAQRTALDLLTRA